MLSTFVSYAAEAAPEHHIELPFSHWGFGGIALALFAFMLGALWSFRNTSKKVPTTSENAPGAPQGHDSRHEGSDQH